MTTPEIAIEWLRKQYKRKEASLMNATKKANASAAEIDSLLETLDVLEYLIERIEGGTNESIRKKSADA